MLLIIMILVFFFTSLVLIQIISFFTRRQQQLEERLRSTSSDPTKKITIRPMKSPVINIGRLARIISLPFTIFGQNFIKKLQDNLLKAGLPFKSEEIITIDIFSVFVAGIIGLTLFHSAIGVIIGGTLGLFLPVFWIKFTKKRRTVKLENQLLDTVVLVASSLKAGHSFLQSLELVSRETQPPLADEIARVLRENRLGIPLEEALNNLKSRVESKDMDLFVAGVLIQRQVGGNLVEVLEGIAVTMDKRIKLRAKIRTYTAQGRLSAWIISILPIALAVFIFGRSPELGRVMTDNPLGIALLISGAFMMIIGIIAVRKVVNIDV